MEILIFYLFYFRSEINSRFQKETPVPTVDKKTPDPIDEETPIPIVKRKVNVVKHDHRSDSNSDKGVRRIF